MSKTSGQRAFDLLKRLAFERLGGSSEEQKAAELLQQELASVGLESSFHRFSIWQYTPKQAVLEVLEPYRKQYQAAVYGLTGCTSNEGVVADLAYVEDAGDAALSRAEGKVVLVNGRLSLEKYERLSKAKVAGFVSWGGEIYRREDIPRWAIRPEYFKHGKIPGAAVFAQDAAEMIKEGARKVRLVVQQDEQEVQSQNVIVEIRGTRWPDEEIVIGAHYDSVPYSSGANDNAAGSVIIMELARHFAANPPKRTLRFIWFGSEELGLRGSYAWVKDNTAHLERVKLMLNVDVAGAILGKNTAIITGPDSLKHYIDVLARMQGLDFNIRQSVYSSDSVPLAEQGIPSVNLIRSGAPIHNRYDTAEYLSPEKLEELAEFSLRILRELDEAQVFPFARQIPDNVKQDLKKYLERTRGKEDKQ